MKTLKAITVALCLWTVTAELSAAAEPPQETGAATFTCVERTATAQPPKGAGAATSQTSPDPACREGQVPVVLSHSTKFFHKGNPRLRSFPQSAPSAPLSPEFVNHYLLRPFDEVYRRGAAPTPAAKPNSPAAAATGCNGVDSYGSCFYYVNAGASFTGAGAGMTLQIEAPIVSSANAAGHSIGEFAVEGTSSGLTDVEMGYIVSPDQFGDSNTHLFVYHWISGAETCYDACGWVQVSSTYFPGMNINSLVGQKIAVAWVQYQGNWWALFNGQYIGYFPNAIWSGSFTQATSVQWYGEVATAIGTTDTTQMGNGHFATQTTAASMTVLCSVASGSTTCAPVSEQGVTVDTQPSYYNYVNLTDGFRYGGPGSN